MSRNLYYKAGIPLKKYCNDNGINYNTIESRIYNLKITMPNLNRQELVDKALEGLSDLRCRYFYKGVSLRKYCKEHGLSYKTILRKINNKTSKEEMEDIVTAYIESKNNRSRPSYKIDGLTLKQYALRHNYVYPTLIAYIQEIRKKYPDKSDNEVVLLAVRYYEENHVPKTQWFYKGVSLREYCKRNNLVYNSIRNYFRCMDIKDHSNIPEEKMELAIKKYYIKIEKDAFKKLKVCQREEEFKEIVNILNINWDSVKLVMNFNYDYIKAIYFVWYFGKEKEGLIKLDERRIKNVYHCLKKVDLLEINFLLGYYRTGIYDTRQLMYNKLFVSIRKIVVYLVKNYRIKFNSDYHKELKAEADMLVFVAINNPNSPRNADQIISYINSYVIGGLRSKINRDLREQKDSLNEMVCQDSNIEKIDTIAARQIDEPTYFSYDMIKIIKSLDNIEQRYIILRFKELYEDEEIASLLNISLEQVLEIREKSLEKLRQDENIKLLKKLD